MFFKAFLVPLVTVALRALALPAQRDGCPVVPLQPNVTGARRLVKPFDMPCPHNRAAQTLMYSTLG